MLRVLACVCVCVRACARVCVYMHCVYLHVGVCVCVWRYVCMCVPMHRYLCTCVCVCLCVSVYICVYVCVQVYVCMPAHTYTYPCAKVDVFIQISLHYGFVRCLPLSYIALPSVQTLHCNKNVIPLLMLLCILICFRHLIMGHLLCLYLFISLLL